MARHIDRSRPENNFVPGDAMLVLSTTWSRDGVTVHLTDMNSETTLDSEFVAGDTDEAFWNAAIKVMQDARDAY